MIRLLALLSTTTLLGAALCATPAYAQEPPIWSVPLAVGPTDATDIDARQGLVVAGGRVHLKEMTFEGEVEQPSPRQPGIYASTDRGATWTRGVELVGEDATPVPIEETPDLVALPDQGPDAYVTFGRDLWRSDDDGRSWVQVGLLPKHPTVLDVMLDGRLVAGFLTGGLAVSADRGVTWTDFASGLSSGRVNDFEQIASAIAVATDKGLYRSTDGGATFTQATTGLMSPSAPALALTSFHNPPTLYVAQESGSFFSTLIYASEDNGATWVVRGQPREQNFFGVIQRGALEMVNQGVVPVLYAGTIAGLWRTTGAAGTSKLPAWERLDPVPGSATIDDLAVEDTDASPSGRQEAVYAAVDKASPSITWPNGSSSLTAPGWYDEFDGGRVCGGLVVHTSGDLIVACGRHVFRSSDDGATWTEVSKGLPYRPQGTGGIGIAADMPYGPLAQAADGSLYTSRYGSGLYRSNAEVTQWNRIPYPGGAAGVATHVSDADRLYAWGTGPNGGDGHILWRSQDRGTTWEPIFETEDYIYGVDTTPGAPDRLIMTVFPDSVQVSNDGGDSWTEAQGLPIGRTSNTSVYRSYLSDAAADVGYAVVSVPGEDPERILFRSDDGGLSWNEVGDTPSLEYEIVLSPWDPDTIFFETIHQGVIISREGGAPDTYFYFNAGLIHGYFTNLTFHPTQQGAMYATNGVTSDTVAPASQWVVKGIDPGS